MREEDWVGDSVSDSLEVRVSLAVTEAESESVVEKETESVKFAV